MPFLNWQIMPTLVRLSLNKYMNCKVRVVIAMPTRHFQKFIEVKIRKFSICGGKIRKYATKIRQKSGKNADTIRKQKSIIKKS
jgi:hypothetical protein